MQQELKRWDSRIEAASQAVSSQTRTPSVSGAAQDALSGSGTERLLIDAAERALRAPRGKLALLLRLSTLKPPAPRPHHLRIAMALLQDTAQRYGGQVFPLRNTDLMLLCAAPDEDNRLVSGQASPLGLPGAMGRLFAADTSDPANLTTLWRLEEEAASFRAYLAQRPADSTVAPLPATDQASGGASAAGLAALETLLATAQIPDLLAQQTAIELRPGRGQPLTARLAPLYRELTFSFATLTEQRDIADACTDPFLVRHFAGRLDARMLHLLQQDLEAGGRLTRPAVRQGLKLHLNLTLEGIISPAFARLSQTARHIGARLGVEITLMEAVSDLPLMQYAHSLLELAGFPLILDGLDQTSLVLTHSAALRPDLVKLTWSPRLADSPPPAKAAIDAAIERLTPARIVLARAETEEALVWGQSRGITRYQGFYLDAVRAAGRIAVCHSARACTLRQCMSRAGTLNAAIRGACGNPGLLDITPGQTPPAKAPLAGAVDATQRT
jgi:EAL domain-containing protein (putative c-di-GMP-specific phosphodiesterase class I)